MCGDEGVSQYGLCLSSWEAGVDCISPLLLAGESLLTHKSMVGRGQGVSQRGFPSPLMWHKKGLLHCPVEAQLTLEFEGWMDGWTDGHTATSSSLLFSIRWLHSRCLSVSVPPSGKCWGSGADLPQGERSGVLCVMWVNIGPPVSLPLWR